MTAYIETFNILGKEFGIEDHKDGRPASEHFMPDLATSRYKLWAGGCGIGEADTIEQARRKIHEYATDRASEILEEATNTAAAASVVLEKLGSDPSYLFRFEAKDETRKVNRRRSR